MACEAWGASAMPDGNVRDEEAVEERAAWNGEHECFHDRATAPRPAQRGTAGTTPRLAKVEATELESLSNAIAARDAANTAQHSPSRWRNLDNVRASQCVPKNYNLAAFLIIST